MRRPAQLLILGMALLVAVSAGAICPGKGGSLPGGLTAGDLAKARLGGRCCLLANALRRQLGTLPDLAVWSLPTP